MERRKFIVTFCIIQMGLGISFGVDAKRVFCLKDRDCSKGYHCSAGVCEKRGFSKTVCLRDTDCASGLICSAGVCVKPHGSITVCVRDADCASGLICSAGVCVKPHGSTTICVRDADCPSGLRCDKGLCEHYEALINVRNCLASGTVKFEAVCSTKLICYLLQSLDPKQESPMVSVTLDSPKSGMSLGFDSPYTWVNDEEPWHRPSIVIGKYSFNVPLQPGPVEIIFSSAPYGDTSVTTIWVNGTCHGRLGCKDKDKHRKLDWNKGACELKCLSDKGCGQGSYCVNGACVECRSDADCSKSGSKHCNTTTNLCVACVKDADCIFSDDGKHCDQTTNMCVQCNKNTDCTADKTLCDREQKKCICNQEQKECVECETNVNCAKNSSKKVCNTQNHTCVECATNTNCAKNPGKKVCNTQNYACVECLADADCGAGKGNKKFCENQNSYACVACLDDTNCPSGQKCSDSNTCVSDQSGQLGVTAKKTVTQSKSALVQQKVAAKKGVVVKSKKK